MEQEASGRVHELEAAFQAFNQMSTQLESSYRNLENRVSELSEELMATRSDRVKQLAEKERLADRLERLLELLPGGVVVLNGHGVVIECNPAAVEFLGEPLLKAPWHEVVARSVSPSSSESGEVSLNNGCKVSISTRDLGSEPGQIILLMDVTEQHALQEMLNHHERLSAMGEMAASMAHQVRTPLASALLYLSNLGRENLSAEDRQRFIEKIIGRMRHLEHMVNDMLQFAHKGSFKMDMIPLQVIIEELNQSLDPQLQACKGILEIDIEKSESMVYGNREALHGVLLNLATNAIKACGEQGLRRPELRLVIRHNKTGAVEFHLYDNGPGIPESIRKKIFSPFFTTRQDGTGLGLAVVLAVIDAHNGEVWVESKEGQGSDFGFSIPAPESQDIISNGAGTLVAKNNVLNMPVYSSNKFKKQD
jgi:two-component system sensor histidine kinase FlrB